MAGVLASGEVADVLAGGGLDDGDGLPFGGLDDGDGLPFGGLDDGDGLPFGGLEPEGVGDKQGLVSSWFLVLEPAIQSVSKFLERLVTTLALIWKLPEESPL